MVLAEQLQGWVEEGDVPMSPKESGFRGIFDVPRLGPHRLGMCRLGDGEPASLYNWTNANAGTMCYESVGLDSGDPHANSTRIGTLSSWRNVGYARVGRMYEAVRCEKSQSPLREKWRIDVFYQDMEIVDEYNIISDRRVRRTACFVRLGNIVLGVESLVVSQGGEQDVYIYEHFLSGDYPVKCALRQGNVMLPRDGIAACELVNARAEVLVSLACEHSSNPQLMRPHTSVLDTAHDKTVYSTIEWCR